MNKGDNGKKESKDNIKYESVPAKSVELKRKYETVDILTNLFKINFSENEYKLLNYSISVEPEIANDNYTLFSKIIRQMDSDLSKYFKRKNISGYNLFGSTNNQDKEITIKTTVDETEYKITFKYASGMDIKLDDDNEEDLARNKKKSFIERTIKDILLKNKNTIKFGDDRTIVKINSRNVQDSDKNNANRETIYKGYFTSAQITSSGLCLLVLNVNKHIRNITVYEKLKELRAQNKNLQESEIRKIIDSYFQKHKTVLTIYGSLRAYRIDYIDFDVSPRKASFNLKTGNGEKTITIEEYYKQQYKLNIKDPEQPLIKVETKARKKQKAQRNLGNNNQGQNQNQNQNQNNNQEEKTIYLLPELVYITGNPTEGDNKNRKPMNKTRSDPNTKMKEICGIKDLISSKDPKFIKDRTGHEKACKAPIEVAKEWGISLGNNLSITGRILPQPRLLFRDGPVSANNGKYLSGKTKEGKTFTEENFIYIYDSNDNSAIKNYLKLLLDKARMKGMTINVDIKNIPCIALNNLNRWDDVLNSLRRLENKAKNIEMAVVFVSPQLEKYYSFMKEYFTNRANFPSQFVKSSKLKDQKKAGSIMFNVVEQINTKMGGNNFIIDFYNEKIIQKGKIYMILGLEISKSERGLDFVMTSTISPNLNKIITTICSVQNTVEEKKNALNHLVGLAIEELRKVAPHPPDYIILYRHGGNKVEKAKLKSNEAPIFLEILKNIFKNKIPKFIYISCTLKCDFKFFEKAKNGSLLNPKSGLCIDSYVTQKGKKEFYLQPQLVNQGTATPCLYEVLYEDIDQSKPEENISTENLQLLSFYLSFYYWTWSGAIREPGALKLASTAMDFFNKHLNGRLQKENKQFKNPEYI